MPQSRCPMRDPLDHPPDLRGSFRPFRQPNAASSVLAECAWGLLSLAWSGEVPRCRRQSRPLHADVRERAVIQVLERTQRGPVANAGA